jgi:hypothetical protein
MKSIFIVILLFALPNCAGEFEDDQRSQSDANESASQLLSGQSREGDDPLTGYDPINKTCLGTYNAKYRGLPSIGVKELDEAKSGAKRRANLCIAEVKKKCEALPAVTPKFLRIVSDKLKECKENHDGSWTCQHMIKYSCETKEQKAEAECRDVKHLVSVKAKPTCVEGLSVPGESGIGGKIPLPEDSCCGFRVGCPLSYGLVYDYHFRVENYKTYRCQWNKRKNKCEHTGTDKGPTDVKKMKYVIHEKAGPMSCSNESEGVPQDWLESAKARCKSHHHDLEKTFTDPIDPCGSGDSPKPRKGPMAVETPQSDFSLNSSDQSMTGCGSESGWCDEDNIYSNDKPLPSSRTKKCDQIVFQPQFAYYLYDEDGETCVEQSLQLD